MEYKFELSVGDWSNDGHGKTESFVVESNKEVEEIREAYFQACDELGFSLDGSYKKTKATPCSEYEEYSMGIETIESLREFGLEITESQEEEWTEDYVETEDMCDLVLAIIMKQDESVELRRIPRDDMPTLHFYGYDEKKRHIGYFGYGLFD